MRTFILVQKIIEIHAENEKKKKLHGFQNKLSCKNFYSVFFLRDRYRSFWISPQMQAKVRSPEINLSFTLR